MNKVLKVPVTSSRAFYRLTGFKGGLLFFMGVAVGLLAAPQTGAELRARLESRLAAARNGGLPSDEDLSL